MMGKHLHALWLCAAICLVVVDLVTASKDGFLQGEKFRLLLTLGSMMAGGMVPEIDTPPINNRRHWGGSRQRTRNVMGGPSHGRSGSLSPTLESDSCRCSGARTAWIGGKPGIPARRSIIRRTARFLWYVSGLSLAAPFSRSLASKCSQLRPLEAGEEWLEELIVLEREG